jgi:hypothetical protein
MGTWGSLHPDRRAYTHGMRVDWSPAERDYVRNWFAVNNGSPVRQLYQEVLDSSAARRIFHENHVDDVSKMVYIYKSMKQ